ncbi:16S rRNA (guanine(527)-N(7))-methyltransferase RsmG [Gracilibacillus oryzae]|uniref:Ribosomal RNA small subunit methyltransferase G n=1 Tax=Gracilibacillus oryzae TaxID=1672701 RepID=A0A7C8GTG3_9BACI|nr:16S rRNA (guanine(527)-N(7))-methyltransferase RsmG [Gracilibacillus oryzae]KAB8136853.1 16S rRNA (guanine(527)-N(7))-methyltransferase RsmG [Gracilibacillus oryzae]
MNVNAFREQLKQKGIELSDYQVAQFEKYYEILVEWNEKMNLTAITEKEEVFVKHFYDSISAAFYFDFTQDIQLCDVGAGAGFPSIPLKICFPNIKVTIVDSLKKRITFLNHLAANLKLQGVSFYHNRAEIFGQDEQFRHHYDVVLARAVAKMSVLSELCLPLVRTNGVFIAMKGANAAQEMEEADAAIELLGGKMDRIETFQLPEDNGERNIVVLNKRKKTPKKYPRKPGVPNKTPLS